MVDGRDETPDPIREEILMSRDDREEEPERRSLSCRTWSTSDRKTHPRGGNARMWAKPNDQDTA